jgi:tRNA A-37 threonylcarbamoyl transferase component Bud32
MTAFAAPGANGIATAAGDMASTHPQPKVLEPGPRAQDASNLHCDWTTTLPEDLLKEQSIRLQLFYAAGVILWAINFAMDIWLAPHGDRGPYALLIEGLGAGLAAAVAVYIRFGRSSHHAKIRLGVAAVVPHAFGLALLNSWAQQPTTIRPISSITVLILFFGMLAPAPPTQMLVAGLITASMDPLGVWIAHLRGLATPTPFNTLAMFYPNYVCAVLAVAPAQILVRLGRQVREARALGSYQLVERLGEGGMGEVWLAHHRLLARSAAIKLIRPAMLSDGTDKQTITLLRFEREAQATAALTSPHTIRLFDFGLTRDDTFYCVMELLNGRDLESLVRSFGPLPPARVMYVIRQVCHSLAEAHAMEFIHRDIKPANIYLCRMGLEYDFAKVLDFGLVKRERRDESTTVTVEPAVIGTPAYMAPEAILGQVDIDRRVDVYAVGCVAYFLLTGELVFRAANRMKVLMQHVQEEPMPPSHRSELQIPPEVDEFVLACLRKDPMRRPSSAEELLQMASACKTADVWDQRAARKWWEVHLPHLAVPPNADATTWGARAVDRLKR